MPKYDCCAEGSRDCCYEIMRSISQDLGEHYLRTFETDVDIRRSSLQLSFVNYMVARGFNSEAENYMFSIESSIPDPDFRLKVGFGVVRTGVLIERVVINPSVKNKEALERQIKEDREFVNISSDFILDRLERGALVVPRRVDSPRTPSVRGDVADIIKHKDILVDALVENPKVLEQVLDRIKEVEKPHE